MIWLKSFGIVVVATSLICVIVEMVERYPIPAKLALCLALTALVTCLCKKMLEQREFAAMLRELVERERNTGGGE